MLRNFGLHNQLKFLAIVILFISNVTDADARLLNACTLNACTSEACDIGQAKPLRPAPRPIPVQENDATADEPAEAIRIQQTAANAQNAQDYSTAANQWERLITEFPQSTLVPNAHYNAGVCYVQPPYEFAKAITHFKEASKRLGADDPRAPDAMLFLGFAQFRLGLETLPRNTSIAADDPAAKKANELLTTSTQNFNSLLEKHGDFKNADQACFFQGRAFETLQRLDDAKTSFEKMLTYEKPSMELDGLFAIANINEQLEDYDAALIHYESLLEKSKAAGNTEIFDEARFRTAITIKEIANRQIATDEAAAKANYVKAAEKFESLADEPKVNKSDLFLELADEAQFQQALCYSRLGEYEKAGSVYERVATRENSAFKIRSLVYAGEAYLKADKENWAVASLNKALETDSPYAVDAALALTTMYLENEDANKAFTLAEQGIAKAANHPLLPNLMLSRAEAVYQNPERSQESPALFLEVADKFPEHKVAASAIYNAAYAQLDAKDLAGAIKNADRFVTNYPENKLVASALEIEADALMMDQKLLEAESQFELLVADYAAKADPKDLARWILRAGLAKYLQEEYQRTIDWLQPNLGKIEPGGKAAEANHWIGSSYFHLGQFQPAVDALQKTIEASPDWKRAAETLLTLSRSQIEVEQADLAEQNLKKLIADYSDSPLIAEANFIMGDLLFKKGEFVSAFANYKTVIDKFSDSHVAPHAIYGAAWCQAKENKPAEAESLFTRLITDFPDHQLAKEAKIGRGSMRRKSGDMAASIEDLNAFLATDPKGSPRFNAMYELGLAHVAEKQWEPAMKVFEDLLNVDAESNRTDRYLYELAWAQQSHLGTGPNMNEAALTTFAQIAEKFPDSSFASEANFHLGSEAYRAGKYPAAIEAYKKCVATEDGTAAVHEKAHYKLGWAYYKQKEFDKSLAQFQKQTNAFPEGALYADGMFMVAESQFRKKDYESALKSYQVAKPVVDASKTVDGNIKLLTMLHGSQSANKTSQYTEAKQLAQPLTSTEDIDDSFQQDAWLEIGSAEVGLGNDDLALKAWQKAKESHGKTGARAYCMIGDLYFRQKKFDQAISEFKLVYYGFGGVAAQPEIRSWQAYALYEAARCNVVQVQDAAEEAKPKLINEAIKQFEFLIKNYGGDRLAPEAAKQLTALKNIKK